MKKSNLNKDIKTHGFKMDNTEGFNQKDIKKMNCKLTEIITDLNKIEGGYNNVYFIKKYKGRMLEVKKNNADENDIYKLFAMMDILNMTIHDITDGQSDLWVKEDSTIYNALVAISEELEQKIIIQIGDVWIKKGLGS